MNTHATGAPMLMRAAAALLLVLLPVAASGTQGHRQKWWQDEKMKAELALTDDQSTEVETIFQASRPKLQEGKRLLESLENDLSEMVRAHVAEEAELAVMIDRVEAARSELSKERTLMLYRMHRILTPEQNAKLKEIYDRRRARETRDRRP
jgi:Spy/CpxP family protein refolding chaperone